jgi:hypothetical protein
MMDLLPQRNVDNPRCAHDEMALAMMDHIAPTLTLSKKGRLPRSQLANPYMTSAERRDDAIANYDEALRVLRNSHAAMRAESDATTKLRQRNDPLFSKCKRRTLT